MILLLKFDGNVEITLFYELTTFVYFTNKYVCMLLLDVMFCGVLLFFVLIPLKERAEPCYPEPGSTAPPMFVQRRKLFIFDINC